MKLVDLHPEWYGSHERQQRGEPNRLGIVFDCPKCAAAGTLATCTLWGRIHVPFANPLDGTPALYPNGWQRTGENFESLTLAPSINAFEPRDDRVSHWHGFVTNGQVTTC